MIARRKTPRPLASWTRAFPEQLTALRGERQPEQNGAAGFKNFTRSKSFARLPRQKPIPKISDKKRKADRLYNALAKEHRRQPGNDYCRVEFALTGRKIPATCNHHIRGRQRTLKFDTRFFCPTASQNSLWPHANIEHARRLGLIAQSGEWNVAPDDAETAKIRDWMIEKGIW